MKAEKEYFLVYNTLVGSLVSDAATLAILLFSIWFNESHGGSFFWNAVCFSGLMIFFTVGKSDNRKVFRSKKEIIDYLERN